MVEKLKQPKPETKVVEKEEIKYEKKNWIERLFKKQG